MNQKRGISFKGISSFRLQYHGNLGLTWTSPFFFFIFTVFHKHLIPVAASAQACHSQRRVQTEPRGGPELRRGLSEQQGPAGARRTEFPAGRAEKPDEGAAVICGAAQKPANVKRLLRVSR